MKKIFTLCATVLMSLGAFAQSEVGIYRPLDLKILEVGDPLVFERLFYSCYVAMAKIRFTEFLPSAGCHHSVCPHYRHLARP